MNDDKVQIPSTEQTTSAPEIAATQLQPPVTAPKVPIYRRLNKKMLIAAGLFFLVTILTLVVLYIVNGQTSDPSLANLPYEYKKSQKVAADKEFKFKVGFTPDDSKVENGEVFRVYSDAALSRPVDRYEYGQSFISWNSEIVLSGRGSSNFYDPVEGTDIKLGGGESAWSYYDKFYIAQYVDLQSGEKLEKPIVHPFEVTRDIQTPKVTAEIDDSGNAVLKWDKIEGTEAYYVVSMHGEGSDNKVITKTTNTSWNASDKDEYQRYNDSGIDQNRGFVTGTSDDEMRDSLYSERNADLNSNAPVEIGVIAIVNSKSSSLGAIKDLDAYRAKLLYTTARNAAKEAGIAVSYVVNTIDDVPKQIPITLADGRTALQSVVIDKSSAQYGTANIYENNKRVATKVLAFKYQVRGTSIKNYYYVKNIDPAKLKPELDRIIDRNLKSQVQVGADANYEYTSPARTIGNLLVKTRPTIDYNVSSTNPLSDYIAANILNGAEFIDVSSYVNDTFPIDIRDAVQEAISQNPLILYVHWNYRESDKVVQVTYVGDIKEMQARTKTIYDEVKRVIASIITPSMSERDKVIAINEYIRKTGTYDYAALAARDSGESFVSSVSKYKDAWSPYGILFDKTAVCGGYAEVFKVLADEAGLESVYVTGNVNTVGLHAWNKVKVDGKWLIVDVTWNDVENNANHINKYLLITEAQAAKLRKQTETNTWIVDIYQKNYASL